MKKVIHSILDVWIGDFMNDNYKMLMRILKNQRNYNLNSIDQILNAVNRANDEVINWIDSINNISKHAYLERFDYEKYYNNMMPDYKIGEYVPLDSPNEYYLRRKIGCLKENKLLEKIFKKREQKRIDRGKEFVKEWDILCNEYQIEEKKNIEKYEAYKKSILKKQKKESDFVLNKKKLYLDKNDNEINGILRNYIFEKINKNNNFGIFVTSNYCNEECVINIKMPLYNDYNMFPEIKKFRYVKSQGVLHGNYFSEKEIEDFYEKFVYNIMLQVSSKLIFYVNGIIKKVIVNCYSHTLNSISGEMEDIFFASASFLSDTINFSNLINIDASSFFSNKILRAKFPFINYNRIIPYSNISDNNNDEIDNNIDGFAFEKLSKQLLEKNGFTNVEVTKASGDYGADVIAYKDDIKYAIQCKKYSNKVGISAIQEVIGSMSIYNCHVGVVLTNNYFTPAAKELANKNNIILWDKKKLDELIKNSNNN